MPRSRSGPTYTAIETWSRSPSEFYLRFCLTKTEAELTDLAREVAKQGVMLPETSLEYLDKLDQEMENDRPDPFSPADLRHQASQIYLTKYRIWDLWHPQRDVTAACDLFMMPPHREHVCALLIGGFSAEQIVKILYQSFGLVVREKSIDLFAHYFWNLRLLTLSEREVLYASCREASVLVDAHMSGRTQVGRLNTLRKLGHDTGIIDPSVICNQILSGISEDATRSREVPIRDRGKWWNEMATATSTAYRTMVDAKTGESQMVKEVVDSLIPTHTATPSVTLSDLTRSGYQPLALPGRGDLDPIEAESDEDEKKEEGNVRSISGARGT